MTLSEKYSYRINVPEQLLEDLSARLSFARWPNHQLMPGWETGTDPVLLHHLTDYWQNHYNWRAQEENLNGFRQFRIPVEGCQLHFVYEQASSSRGESTLPVLVLHGWPSTFVQMTRILPLLIQSCDVVVPSLPGFAFSDQPDCSGANLAEMARTFHILMTRVLGYERYVVRGTDYGLAIALILGSLYPESVAGVHVGGTHLEVQEVPDDLEPEEREFIRASRAWYADEGGYVSIQSTKPQTLGYALNDSPVGLLAWITEKHRTWCADPDNLLEIFDEDYLLTTAMIYWVDQTITSSMRLYYEERLRPSEQPPVGVPLAINQPALEEFFPPRSWWERFQPVRRWTLLEGAGHFPEWEAPYGLVKDLREFIGTLR